MGLGEVGALVSGGGTLLAVVLAAVAWLLRQRGQEAREGRQLRASVVAAVRWHYRVTALAALRGWDADPSWPETPVELTADYLLEKDEGGGLASLADQLKSK